ncbi:DUF2017 domain-containing protein [Nocardiopsis suaedae]|uniref:DUF2017 domain-containing protein n=1 Tax=Nocardiopsis suaedae TaxID=3018444 RepID=A0ABT4TIJ8_9ACTN|nr:DUF2017 domain-containing protein [Nocardiopsis suaedae]MDA2804535.1 DUF2017 domain-containing protein [Nocardiopsis suaedae]
MTDGFRAVRGGVSIRLDRDEAAVLRSMAGLVLELVEPPEGGGDPLEALVGLSGAADAPDAPEDPVLARLLPDAYGGDREASGEFRRYTEGDLRRHKRENAEAVISGLSGLGPDGGELVLDTGDAHAWLKALNDVRLALGTRLGVEEDGGETRVRADGPADRAALSVYEWLGGVQETLVQALMAER